MVHVKPSSDSAEVLLNECPFCGYSLEGLPVQHNCPECGRESDRRWKVFGDRLGWQHWSPVQRWLCILSLGSAAVLSLCQVLAGKWDFGSRDFYTTLFGAAIFPIGLVYLWRYSARSRQFIVVGPDSVSLADRRKPQLESYPLASLRQARAGSSEWLILGLMQQEYKLCRFRNGRHEAEECAAYINSQLSRNRMRRHEAKSFSKFYTVPKKW
jgi:hypothetical protein